MLSSNILWLTRYDVNLILSGTSWLKAEGLETTRVRIIRVIAM
jgi:hypothetical protein